MPVVIHCPTCTLPMCVSTPDLKLGSGRNFFCDRCNNGQWWHITMLSEAPGADDDGPPLQESPEKKALWRADAEKRMPVGTRVKVISSDMSFYLNQLGTVVGYDLGVWGEWPQVTVEFVAPVNGCERDGFVCDGGADDEIVKWDPCECCDEDPCVHADEVPDGWGGEP